MYNINKEGCSAMEKNRGFIHEYKKEIIRLVTEQGKRCSS
jgi:hypothetical protein